MLDEDFLEKTSFTKVLLEASFSKTGDFFVEYPDVFEVDFDKFLDFDSFFAVETLVFSKLEVLLGYELELF